MITAKFRCSNNRKVGFSISGHAGYAENGRDIVCAAVTSAVELCANGITEIIGVNADVAVNENEIILSLPQNSDERAYDFMEALFLHLNLLSQNYGKNVKVIITEV